ncbi:MAG: type II toxin-antitoxin system RelE/ParE family toxin [Oscillibacter sp.]|nr:type II toxin-antitoxin system RelE/ParE family toxin [Oscillibacter sp.]
MTREFVWTTAFLSGWHKCGVSDDDLSRLEDALLDDPKAGDVIKGTGGARKFRFEYEGRGKSGSTRVIYVDIEIGEKICGLAAYAKADKDNLTQGERNAIRKLIQLIEPYYNKPSGKEEP